MRTLFFILLLLTANSLFGQKLQANLQLSPEEKAKIGNIVNSYSSINCFSGSVLVAKGNHVLFEKGYGLANREDNLPVNSNTKFFIASLSKSFTAAAILILEERGLLNLNDPVNKFLPDYPHGDSVRIIHLLQHMAGIPNLLFFPEYADISKHNYPIKDLVKLFWEKPLQFEPGKGSQYSNSNYILLAYIIEVVSGKPYAQFVRENLTGPLKMENTASFESWKPLVPNRAHGYAPVGFSDFHNAEYYDYSINVGAGSIYSTSEDLLKWTQGVFKGEILNKYSTGELLSTADSGKNSIAWSKLTINGRISYHINGWDGEGFSANITYFPAEDISIIALCNLNISSVTGEIFSRVSALIFNNDYLPFKVYKAKYTEPRLNEFSGKYQLGADFYVPSLVLQIVVKDGVLYELQSSGVLMGLIPTGKDEFMHRSSFGKIKFTRDGNGKITGMVFYGRFNAIKI